ncbi:LOW QUALITY PROTEIN: hypothetical protein Cgig2_018066 [Carnegiea gigantea]|uniref:DUF4283 domain-containing protein n=1 Tax=Carnegiea gigantea TaxID=171969 RepID=A0A9Q1GH27_9CARY|nr:LOW QUALITY PROTEIN: hypothetical protein Cgig2_018066 [Carnegiea gigantea]
MEINTDAITSLPIWIQLPELDIKYLGMQSLSKIGSLLGYPSKIDKYTKDKSMLKYVRLMICLWRDNFKNILNLQMKKGSYSDRRSSMSGCPSNVINVKCLGIHKNNIGNRITKGKNRGLRHQPSLLIKNNPQRITKGRGWLPTSYKAYYWAYYSMNGGTHSYNGNNQWMVGFLETKVKESNIQHVCANWKWEHNATMIERGRIILSWHLRKYNFSHKLKTDQLLHGEVKHLPTNRNFFLTLVYGRNMKDQRLPLWEDLGSIAMSLQDLWCVLGDFNSVLRMSERIGGVGLTEGEIRDFASYIT